MERTYTHRGVTFTVRLNARPGRRMQWTFTAPTATGSGVTGFGMEVAFRNGKDAGEAAIDRQMDGS